MYAYCASIAKTVPNPDLAHPPYSCDLKAALAAVTFWRSWCAIVQCLDAFRGRRSPVTQTVDAEGPVDLWSRTMKRSLTATLAVFTIVSLACEEEVEEPEVDLTPVLGLLEIPISRNNQGTAPSDAVTIELTMDALRMDGTTVLDLTNGRPLETEIRDGAYPALRSQIDGGPARSRASLRVYASAPYATLVETMNTIQGAGLRELHFAVRTPGASPSEGWMPVRNWRVVGAEEEFEFQGRPLPWSAFTEHWRDVYEACRAGRYVDCDGPYANTAEGGTLGMELWTRGQAMKVTFNQATPGEEEPAGEGGGGGVQLIEGIAAPAPVDPEEEHGEPATVGAFTLRHQEAVNEPSAISNTVQPVCANAVCQATVVTDATAPSMRVISMIGAVFPQRVSASPSSSFVFHAELTMSNRVESTLEGFSVVVERHVRWGDLDAFAHLNNTVYFRFFEGARIAYFDAMGMLEGAGKPEGVGPILAKTSCKFRAPIGFPDQVRTGARVTEVSGDRFVMQYAIVSEARDVVAAIGDGTIVAFDYDAQRSVSMPADWRDAIRRLDGV